MSSNAAKKMGLKNGGMHRFLFILREWRNSENFGDSGEKRKNLLELNNDCLHAIFNLVSTMDLVNVAQTCSRLRKIAYETFQNKFKVWEINKNMANTPIESRKFLHIFGSRILSLKIRFSLRDARLDATAATSIMDAVIRYCTTLKCLELTEYKIPDSQDAIDKMAKLFRNLKKLKMNDVSIEGEVAGYNDWNNVFTQKGHLMNLFKNCQSLADLELWDSDRLNRVVFESAFPKLQHFKCFISSYMNHIEGFVFRHNNLKSFSLDATENDFDCHLPALNVVAANCKLLEKIEFGLEHSNHRVECKKFMENLSKRPTLKQIKMLVARKPISAELPKFRDTLQVLDLEFINIPGLIPAVCQLKQLKLLRMSDVESKLVDINPLGELTQLNALLLHYIDEENLKFDFVNLVNRLENLQKLQFRVCQFKVSNQTYRRLVDIVERRPNWENRSLRVDCPTTSDFIDLKLETVKFIELDDP